MANPILNIGPVATANASSITLTFPTTYAGGTAMAFIMSYGSSSGTPPGSWTAIGGGQTVMDAASSRLTHLQLATDGTEGATTQAFTFSGSNRRVGFIVATDGSLGQVSTGGYSAAATSINHDTVTTVNDNSAIIYLFTGSEASPILADYTVAQTELGEGATALGSSDVYLGIGYENFPTAGTTTTRTSTGPGDAASTLGQKTISVYVTGASAPTISSTSNPKAGETATITVDDSTGVTSATYGGIALTSVATPTGTTVTGVMPIGGLALGSSNDFTVTNGTGTSAGFADTYEPRTGYSYFTATADASAFNTASPWYNLAGMVTGDQVEYELALDPSSGITITSVDAATGLPTLSASITVDNVSSYYVWDASDTYSVGTIGTINWEETVAPTISTMVIDASGNLVVTLSETVTAGLDGFNGFTVTGFSGGAVTFTYSSGDTTTALTLTASRSIYSNEGNGTGAYTQPGDGVQDESALNNVLATASGVTVTNNSALVNPTAVASISTSFLLLVS